MKNLCLIFKNVPKSRKKVRFAFWLDGNIEKFNAEFIIHNNIPVKRMSISVHSY
jgi:hypothetical protein